MALLITGCAKDSPAGTTPVSPSNNLPEYTTQPTQPEFVGMVDQLLQDDCVVVEGKTWEEYEEILHELGFVEFRTDLSKSMIYRENMYIPHALRYNDMCFKLQFDYCNYDIELVNSDEMYILEERVLYGMKDADIKQDISSYNKDFYEYHTTSNARDMFPEFVSTDTYLYCGNTMTGADEKVYISAYHYQDTRNLYNLTFQTENLKYNPASPYILCKSSDDLNKPVTTTRIYQMEIVLDDVFQESYFYEEGMTFADWVHSTYNEYSGWEESDNIAMLAITYDYGCLIMDADKPIKDFLEPDGFTIIAQKYVMRDLLPGETIP